MRPAVRSPRDVRELWAWTCDRNIDIIFANRQRTDTVRLLVYPSTRLPVYPSTRTCIIIVIRLSSTTRRRAAPHRWKRTRHKNSLEIATVFYHSLHTNSKLAHKIVGVVYRQRVKGYVWPSKCRNVEISNCRSQSNIIFGRIRAYRITSETANP